MDIHPFLDRAVEWIDELLLKQSNGCMIKATMLLQSFSQVDIHDLIRKTIGTLRVSPTQLLHKLTNEYGRDTFMILLPNHLKKDIAAFIIKKEEEESSTNSINSLISTKRCWKWLGSSGKHELRKCKSLYSLLNILKPFCESIRFSCKEREQLTLQLNEIIQQHTMMIENIQDNMTTTTNDYYSISSCARLSPSASACFMSGPSDMHTFVTTLGSLLPFPLQFESYTHKSNSLLSSSSSFSQANLVQLIPEKKSVLKPQQSENHVVKEKSFEMMKLLMTPLAYIESNCQNLNIASFIGNQGEYIRQFQQELESICEKELSTTIVVADTTSGDSFDDDEEIEQKSSSGKRVHVSIRIIEEDYKEAEEAAEANYAISPSSLIVVSAWVINNNLLKVFNSNETYDKKFSFFNHQHNLMIEKSSIHSQILTRLQQRSSLCKHRLISPWVSSPSFYSRSYPSMTIATQKRRTIHHTTIRPFHIIIGQYQTEKYEFNLNIQSLKCGKSKNALKSKLDKKEFEKKNRSNFSKNKFEDIKIFRTTQGTTGNKKSDRMEKRSKSLKKAKDKVNTKAMNRARAERDFL